MDWPLLSLTSLTNKKNKVWTFLVRHLFSVCLSFRLASNNLRSARSVAPAGGTCDLPSSLRTREIRSRLQSRSFPFKQPHPRARTGPRRAPHRDHPSFWTAMHGSFGVAPISCSSHIPLPRAAGRARRHGTRAGGASVGRFLVRGPVCKRQRWRQGSRGSQSLPPSWGLQ